MGRLSLVCLLLPALAAGQLVGQSVLVPTFYQPLYSPLMVALQPPQGNRKYVSNLNSLAYQKQRPRENTCQDMTENWFKWETGASANVNLKRVKRPQPGSRAVQNSWSVELVWDKPVKKLQVYNGVADQTEGTHFKISPPPWNFPSALNEDPVFSFNVAFDKDGEAPRLSGIIVDGKYQHCEKIKSKTQASPTLNSARLGWHAKWPKKTLGLYILLSDDSEAGYETKSDSWTPKLYSWQQETANVLFFTFIHPGSMEVPVAFEKLAKTRGTNLEGAVPKDTVIMFAIGGYAYSLKPNPWDWLTTREKAEAMALEVSKWPDKYGCDGIDLDLEEGAGSNNIAGPNMVHFIERLKELNPDLIVTQPTYGYPQVQGEIDVINASWDDKGNSKRKADHIGLMVYEGTTALNFVKNFAKGATQWQGFPIKVNVPYKDIMLGSKGGTSKGDLVTMANEVCRQDLCGIMVWYSSVIEGLQYGAGGAWDASDNQGSIDGYAEAKRVMDQCSG